jgi:hypothetical protein
MYGFLDSKIENLFFLNLAMVHFDLMLFCFEMDCFFEKEYSR